MCGLAGILGTRTSDETALYAMAATLRHRGPDDEGAWFDRTVMVGLAHRRLSVLDLSASGHQPMLSADDRYVIAFNGEIYNHLRLRAQLEQARQAPRWRGHSDTETLLAGFCAWGIEATVRKSVGMFAFAVWDSRDRVLTLGRDRFGEKPLYYGWVEDTFLFGSELKAIRAHPAFKGEIDREALAAFMRYSYIPAPKSIYRGIRKLLPGALLSVRAEDRGKSEPIPYWSLREVAQRGVQLPFTGSDREALEGLETHLSEAVAIQRIADVPLGAFLSGGIDSSTIVALMQTQSSRPVHTFTIGFHDPEYNEAAHAKLVAEHLGANHTELYVTPQEAMAVIQHLPTLYDEPFADPSQIPTLLVCQLARRQVTVSLSGDAGDELFGGYNRYVWASELLRYPASLRRTVARALAALSPVQWDRIYATVQRVLPARLRIRTPGDKAHKLASVLHAKSEAAVYQRLVSTWLNPDAVVLGGQHAIDYSTTWSAFADFGALEHQMMALDTCTYLPDDILCKVDRAAMSVSLETRIPFLDHRVVEFAWTLPLRLKIGKGERKGKWILRQLLSKYVPEKLIERPKMGFGVPIDAWLRGPLREWAEELLDPSRLREEGWFHPAPIRVAWAEHLSGERNWQYQLWNALMFQSWLEDQKTASSQKICRFLGGRSSVRN